jgi:hypothetical protein
VGESMKRSFSGELGCAPASDSCRREPHHGLPRRARGARGGHAAARVGAVVRERKQGRWTHARRM